MADEKHRARGMTDDELSNFISDWKENKEQWLAGMQELKRRERGKGQRIAQSALGIALVSLALSIAALVM